MLAQFMDFKGLNSKNSITQLSAGNLLLYVLVLFFIFLMFRTQFYGLGDRTGFGNIMFILSGLISIALLNYQYRSLRNRLVFLIWLLLSVMLFVLFVWMRTDPSLNFKLGIFASHYANGLKVPLLLLAEYYLFTRLTLKHYQRGLVKKTSKFSDYDENEGREMLAIDHNWLTVSTWTLLLGHLF